MSWRRQAASSSRSASAARARAEGVASFHEALRAGRVDVVRRMVFQDASLVHARAATSPHETSLMVAASSATASVKSVLTLLHLLLAKGASLRTKDDRHRQTLMCVCAAGVRPAIVDFLLANDRQGALQWSDRDDDGFTALTLACVRGYGRLASYILDVLPVEQAAGPNAPLNALKIAMQSGDERCVLDLLRNRKLQSTIEANRAVETTLVHGEWLQLQGQRRRAEHLDEEVSVSSCTSKAVRLDMVRVVQQLHRLNRQCVGHATWLELYRLSEPRGKGKALPATRPKVQPRLAAIAAQYRRDRVWACMRLTFLVRYAPGSQVERRVQQRNVVAELPDVLFRLVAEFLKPSFDDAEEAQKARFQSVLAPSAW